MIRHVGQSLAYHANRLSIVGVNASIFSPSTKRTGKKPDEAMIQHDSSAAGAAAHDLIGPFAAPPGKSVTRQSCQSRPGPAIHSHLKIKRRYLKPEFR